MAVPNEAQIVYDLFVAMNASYTAGVSAAKPQWSMIATEVPSTGAANYYGWMKDIPGIQEWVGARQLVALGAHGYAIENKTWETSITVKRENVDDDQIGIYGPIAQKFGEDVALFPDELTFGLLKTGFTTLCFDGQNFFDSDHPLDTTPASTYSNVVGNPATDVGSPWFLLDTSKVLKPIIFQNRRPFEFKNMNPSEEYSWFNNQLAAGTDGRCNVGFGFPQTAIGSKATLNKANYEQAVKMLGEMKKSSGVPLGTRHTTLVVGYANRAAAKALIDAVTDAAGAANIYYKDVEVVVSPYLV